MTRRARKTPIFREYYPDPGAFGVGFRNKWQKLKNPHVHTGLEIGVFLSGTGRMYLNGEYYSFEAGDFYFTDAMIPHGHETTIKAPIQFIYTCMSYNSILSCDPESQDIRLFQPFAAVHSGISPIIKNIRKAGQQLTNVLKIYRSGKPFAHLNAWAKLLPVLVSIAENVLPRINEITDRGWITKNRLLTDAVTFIRSNFRKKLTIAEIARHCSSSESSLSHTFSKSTGSSPIEYRNTLRIGHAIELISSTENSLEHIADECGFNSYSQFRQTFKRITGKTPGMYKTGKQA